MSGVRLGRNSLDVSINCSEIWILSFIQFPEVWGVKCKSSSDQDMVSDQSSSENTFAQLIIIVT